MSSNDTIDISRFKKIEELEKYVYENMDSEIDSIESSIDKHGCPYGGCKKCYLKRFSNIVDGGGCVDLFGITCGTDVYEVSKHIVDKINKMEVGFDFE